MTSSIEVVAMARAAARHATVRQGLISENIANADTVGFKARDVASFSEVYDTSGPDGPARDASFAAKATRPGHPGFEEAGLKASIAAEPEEIAKLGAETRNGNTVSLEDQMTRGVTAALNHEMALGVMRKASDILRMAIGRAR